MKLQLSLDRVTISEAIEIAEKTVRQVDWLEVGTSLVKEFGMESVRRIREAFPTQKIMVDMKINDNARYESRMAFAAGADAITVMGTSPLVTIRIAAEEAAAAGKLLVIDLLHTDATAQQILHNQFPDAIFCLHSGWDEQKENQTVMQAGKIDWQARKTSVGGRVTMDMLKGITEKYKPEIVIVGSAITDAEDIGKAAADFQTELQKLSK